MVQFVKNSRLRCLLLVVASLIYSHALFAGVNGGRIPPLITGDTIRILLIGTSFSNNATTYLREIAQSDGKVVILGRDERTGWPLQYNWHEGATSEADHDHRPVGDKEVRRCVSG